MNPAFGPLGTGGADDSIGRLLEDAMTSAAKSAPPAITSPEAASVKVGTGSRYSMLGRREEDEVTAKSDSLDLVALEAAAAQSDKLQTSSVVGEQEEELPTDSQEESTLTAPLAHLKMKASEDHDGETTDSTEFQRPPSLPDLSEISSTMPSASTGEILAAAAPPRMPSLPNMASRPEVSEDIVAPARTSVRPPVAVASSAEAPPSVAPRALASVSSLSAVSTAEKPAAINTTPVVTSVVATKKRPNVVGMAMLAAGVLVGFGFGYVTAKRAPQANASTGSSNSAAVAMVERGPAAPFAVPPPAAEPRPVAVETKPETKPAAAPVENVEPPSTVAVAAPVVETIELDPKPVAVVPVRAAVERPKPVHAAPRVAAPAPRVAIAKPAVESQKPAAAAAPKPAHDDDVAARIAAANKELESALR